MPQVFLTQNAPQIPLNPMTSGASASMTRSFAFSQINSLESRINIGGGRRRTRTLSQGEGICLFLACGHIIWVHAVTKVILLMSSYKQDKEGQLKPYLRKTLYTIVNNNIFSYLLLRFVYLDEQRWDSVAHGFLAIYQRRGQPVRSLLCRPRPRIGRGVHIPQEKASACEILRLDPSHEGDRTL